MFDPHMTVSILVPVYGVEQYIEQCAVSLFEQTYKEIEYIFVDDCSVDHSIDILNDVLSRYPSRRAQVRMVRHELNRGLGAARKTALSYATGEFVLNVDSDDYLPLDAVERLVQAQLSSGADIVSGAFLYLYPDGSTRQETCLTDLSRQRMLRLFLAQNTIPYNIWARLIRRTLYTDHGIDAIEGINYAEDYALTSRLLFVAKTTCNINHAVSVYRLATDTGTFHQMHHHHAVSLLKANEVVWHFFQANDKNGEFGYALELGMLNTMQRVLAAGLSKKEITEYLHYRPQRLLFRLCHACFAHKPVHRLLRLTYLALKWWYKRLIPPSCIHQGAAIL